MNWLFKLNKTEIFLYQTGIDNICKKLTIIIECYFYVCYNYDFLILFSDNIDALASSSAKKWIIR